jgi:hypothetical protein
MRATAPFILIDGADVLFFRDDSSLLSYVEPTDVASGAFTAFDSHGRYVTLTTEPRTERRILGLQVDTVFSPVTLHAETHPSGADVLQRKLREYLSRIDPIHKDIDTLGLPALLRRAIGSNEQ